MRGPKHPFIIDVEASGLGADSYPIEIGVALQPGQRYSCLIAPAPSWQHWDDGAEKLHGISRAKLQASGKPATQVAATLNERLAGLVLFSDGWVVDKPWISRLFRQARMSMTFHVSPLELILTEPQMALWQDEKRKVIAESDLKRHRASVDAWVIQETFIRTRAIVEARNEALRQQR